MTDKKARETADSHGRQSLWASSGISDMAQWACRESGGGDLEITSQGMQAARLLLGVSGSRLRAPGSSSGSFLPSGLAALETISGRYPPSPRAMADGVVGAGNTMPVSHIPP